MGIITSSRHPFTSAIILAAGSGTRFSDVPGAKQNYLIGGIPVVALTVRAFDKCALIDEIVLVCRADDEKKYNTFAEKYGIKTPLKIVGGGSERMESAEAGICAVEDKSKFVAIHDGVRCLITPADIEKTVRAAYRDGAAALGTRAVDTIKYSEDGHHVKETLDRKNIWLIGTPQVFGANMYRASLYMTMRDGATVTDDCMMAERLGFKVTLVEASRDNFKITSEKDAILAEMIMKRREKLAAEKAKSETV